MITNATYYCNQNVRILKEGFEKFRSLLLNEFNLDTYNFVSCGFKFFPLTQFPEFHSTFKRFISFFLNTKQEGNDVSIMEHIAEVLVKLTDYGADRPIDYFEPFSYIVKEERQNANDTEPEKKLVFNEKLGPNFVEIGSGFV